MNKKSVEKPLTEESFKKLFPKLLQASFKEYFPSAFQDALEPYALAIQQDFAKSKERDDRMAADISDLQEGQQILQESNQMLQESNQRIEQRQIAEIKRKDILSIKLDNHEKRIIRLEKNPIS